MAVPILGDTENRFSGRPNRLLSRRKCFPVAEGGVSSRQSSNVFPVLLALIKTLGWLAAHSPEWLMRLFAHARTTAEANVSGFNGPADATRHGAMKGPHE